MVTIFLSCSHSKRSIMLKKRHIILHHFLFLFLGFGSMVTFSGQFCTKYFPVIKVINGSKTWLLKTLLCINISNVYSTDKHFWIICLFITVYYKKKDSNFTANRPLPWCQRLIPPTSSQPPR